MEEFCKWQMKINDLTKESHELLSKRIDCNVEKVDLCFETIKKLIGILEDHEKDMKRMAEEINRLNELLKEKES